MLGDLFRIGEFAVEIGLFNLSVVMLWVGSTSHVVGRVGKVA